MFSVVVVHMLRMFDDQRFVCLEYVSHSYESSEFSLQNLAKLHGFPFSGLLKNMVLML